MNLYMYIIMYDCLAIACNMYYMYSDIYSDSPDFHGLLWHQNL